MEALLLVLFARSTAASMVSDESGGQARHGHCHHREANEAAVNQRVQDLIDAKPASNPPHGQCCHARTANYSHFASSEAGGSEFVYDGNYHPALRSSLHARGVFVLKRLVDTTVLNEMQSMLTRQAVPGKTHPLMVQYQPNRPKLGLYPGYPFNVTGRHASPQLQEFAHALEREWFGRLNPTFFIVYHLLSDRTEPAKYNQSNDYFQQVMRIATMESVSGSPVSGSVFQNVHWDVRAEVGAHMVTVNFALIDVPDRSFGPFEIWPGTQSLSLHPEQVFAHAAKYITARGDAFQCFNCYDEINALTRLWPSFVVLTQLGDAIIRFPSTWHRGTPLTAAATQRHMSKARVGMNLLSS